MSGIIKEALEYIVGSQQPKIVEKEIGLIQQIRI